MFKSIVILQWWFCINDYIHIFLYCSFILRISIFNQRYIQSDIDHFLNRWKVSIFTGQIRNLTWNDSDNHLYILLFGTTLTGVVLLLNYFQQKKKKKKDEEQVDSFYCDNYFLTIVSIEKRIFKM